MKLTRFLPCFLLLLACPVARATISYEIDADLLSNSSNVGIPDGSAIFFVVDTTGAGFVLPTAGSFSVGSAWGGSSHNFVLDTYSANGVAFNGNSADAGSVSFVTNTYDAYGKVAGLAANDHLGLFWFSGVSYSAGTITLSAGNTFGYFDFNSSGSDANTWITPADGNSGLFFELATSNAVVAAPGNDVVSYGAINVVVPEPSTYALLGGFTALGAALLRRRKAS